MEFGRHHEHDVDDHRENERIVELMAVPGSFEADVIVAALEARGITASTSHSGTVIAGYMAKFPRVRVYVFENDLEVARALVAERGLDDDGALDER